jgi:hypothetical protein
MAGELFLWESLTLSAFGALASMVVSAMAAAVLNFANVDLPLSVQLFSMSNSFEPADWPSALGGAIALITLVTAAHVWAIRRLRRA